MVSVHPVQRKMHELLEKMKMLAKAQVESEKVESIKWAREYVTHSMLLWFVSIAVGLRAICAVLGCHVCRFCGPVVPWQGAFKT